MKKVVMILLILTMVFVPQVFAYDGENIPDSFGMITLSYEIDFDEILIDEVVEFTLILQNNTEREFKLTSVSQVFDGNPSAYDPGLIPLGEREPTIGPYETVRLDYTYQIPKKIEWYCMDGGYYADFAPIVKYWTDNREMEFECATFRNECTDVVPMRITNLSDGSDYLQMEYADQRSRLLYTDIAFQDLIGYEGEYYAQVISYVNLKNIADDKLEIVTVLNSTQYFGNIDFSYMLYEGQTMTLGVRSSYYKKPEDVPENETTECKAIFSVEPNEYLAVSASRELETVVYPMPDVELILKEVDGVNKYSIKNLSDTTIENFFVMYNNIYPETKKELLDSIMMGDFAPGDEWEIPIVESQYRTSVNIGYYVEDSIACWDVKWVDESILMRDYDFLSGFTEDYYHWMNGIELTDITVMAEEPSTPTPEPNTPTPEPTDEPEEPEETPKPTKEQVTSENDDEYDADTKWRHGVLVYFGIGAAGVVCLAIVVSAIARKKKQH